MLGSSLLPRVSQIPSELRSALSLLCSHALQFPFPSSPLPLHTILVLAKHKAARCGCSGAFSAIGTYVVNDWYQRTDWKKSLSSGHSLFLSSLGKGTPTCISLNFKETHSHLELLRSLPHSSNLSNQPTSSKNECGYWKVEWANLSLQVIKEECCVLTQQILLT